MNNLTALICGILFGGGLAMSGMTDTAKVLGFLDLFGEWVPDLAFVMGSAVFVTLALTPLILGLSKPLLAQRFYLPEKPSVDIKLITGSLFFGLGWGLYGYCPGPAIASLAYLEKSSAIFVAAMLVGMLLGNKTSARF